jgi:hypothetical protein
VAYCGRQLEAEKPADLVELIEWFGECMVCWNVDVDLSNVGVGSGEMGGWRDVSRTSAYCDFRVLEGVIKECVRDSGRMSSNL